MSNENSKLLSTLDSNVDSTHSSQNSSNCFKYNTSEKNDLKEFDDSETELKEDSETELKDLLEEAYSYKTPGDKKNKSKKFLQLLEEVESETEDNGKFPQSLTRYGTTSSKYHHNQSHGGHQKYGGSLQDLVDAKRADAFFDIDCHSSKSRRNFVALGGNQISRNRKNSSVSTRQREGGSLPSNVNNTNLDLRKDQLKHHLLHEVTKTTNTITTTTTTKECLHNSDTNTTTTGSIGPLTSIGTLIVNSMADTVIDMEVDSVDEDQTYISNISNNIKCKSQKKTLRGSNDTGKLECVELIDQKHYVDEKVIFSSLDSSTNIESLNRGLPLDESYKSYTSVLEKRNTNIRTSTIVTTASSLSNAIVEEISANASINVVSSLGSVSLKQYDENGNLNMANSPNGVSGSNNNTSINSQSQAKAKSTKRQKEKNVRVFKAGDIPCNCGDQDINTLVSFINNDNPSIENKNKKLKKKEKDKAGVLKKSSSLEELRSCTKLTSDDNDNVTLRNKGVKQKLSKSNNNNVVRKGERRSWGTEELPYYGELTTEDSRTKKKTSDVKINKKDVYCTEIHSKGHSMESINSEPSDFLLVTKKKKPKKRQTMDDSSFSQNHNHSGRSGVFIKKHGQGNNDFQSYRRTSNFLNDKECYYNSQTVNQSLSSTIHNQKSRRKSTSSMPPSDKSDLSDSDSVHSLPIENKKSQNTSMKQKNQKNQPQSYAEITKRKKSQGNTIITATTTNNLNEVTANTTKDEDCNVKLKPKTRHKTVIDFPELVPNIVSTTSIVTSQQISYSQSLVSPALANNEVTSPTTITPSNADYEFIQPKQVLYKSKSMDNESDSRRNSKNNSQSSTSLLYNSIDQYPALEKTVKRHNVAVQQTILANTNHECNINESKLSFNEKCCAIEAKKRLCHQISKRCRKPCASNTSFNKNVNRPAVIILNDDSNQIESSKLNQFTFGDFKEDELKFLGNSDETAFNMNSTIKSNQDINISLESDNGYSSSLNQSAKNMDCALTHEDDANTTEAQNNNQQHKSEQDNILYCKNTSGGRTKKIITCSEIEDSLTSQLGSSNTRIHFNFIENAEDEEYIGDEEDDETNATTSTHIGDEENYFSVNENNIEIDINQVNSESSCSLSFKPPPRNMQIQNERIIDFIGTAWEEVSKSKITLFYKNEHH